jgi:DNA-binding transcriptional LysR family regulator
MDIDHLRHFLIVAEAGSLTRAAGRLHLSQPALSAQIRALEADLGTELFQRQARGLRLTPAGDIFRRHAVGIISQVEAARGSVGSLGSLNSGAIAIGGGATATTCLLPEVVRDFHLRHPGIRFTIREAPSRTIVQAVADGELDLGIVTLPVPRQQSGMLTVTPWLVDELVLIAPDAHPLAQRHSFHWQDLHNQQLIAFEHGSAVRNLLDARLAEHRVRPALVMELRSIAAILNMVAAGIGLGFISRLADSSGRGLTCAEQPLSRQLALIERRDHPPSAALAAFRAALLDRTGR